MKILTKTKLVDIKGKEFNDVNLGEAMAEFLLLTKDTLKVKRNSLATKLSTLEEVEIDAGDKMMIKNAAEKDLETFGKFNTVISAQIINYLDGLK